MMYRGACIARWSVLARSVSLHRTLAWMHCGADSRFARSAQEREGGNALTANGTSAVHIHRSLSGVLWGLSSPWRIDSGSQPRSPAFG